MSQYYIITIAKIKFKWFEFFIRALPILPVVFLNSIFNASLSQLHAYTEMLGVENI